MKEHIVLFGFTDDPHIKTIIFPWSHAKEL